MERRHGERGPAPEFRLSPTSADEVVGRTGPPRAREHFLSTDHLSTEAAAAYVDGRLPHAGQLRADAHLERCADCRREVDHQREARHVLRGSGPIHMPRDLLERLRNLGDADTTTSVPPGAPGGTPPAVDAPASPFPPRTPWERLLRRVWRRGR